MRLQFDLRLVDELRGTLEGPQGQKRPCSVCLSAFVNLPGGRLRGAGRLDIPLVTNHSPVTVEGHLHPFAIFYRIRGSDTRGEPLVLEGQRPLAARGAGRHFSLELGTEDSKARVTGRAPLGRLLRSLRLRVRPGVSVSLRGPAALPRARTLLALIEGIFWDCENREPDPATLLERLGRDVRGWGAYGLVAITLVADLVALLGTGRTLVRLGPSQRQELLGRLLDARGLVRPGLGALLSVPFKLAFAAAPEVHARLEVPYRKDPPAPEPAPRWMQQIFAASTFVADETVECEVVVVGTGAGGAVVAKELAERGHAVALIEAGAFLRREAFTGNPRDMMPRLYRAKGATFSVGNVPIVLPMGRAVGGSTLINSATCFRAPEAVLNAWAAAGLTDFTPEKMAPFYERVEGIIHVQECEERYIGPIGEVIREGCRRLGYSCGPLRHNTIDCDGQGVCTQGCPTDAKQSTNIAYVPKALSSGAQLFTGFEVEEILTDGERAVGVRATGRSDDGRRVRLTCLAHGVVLSCGSLITPTLIQKNRLVRSNPWIGSNLTIHPAAYVGAIFPGRMMKNHCSIPQGYMIDAFHDEGIMFEGATAPFMLLMALMPGLGRDYGAMVDSYHQLGIFGFMIKDTGTGWVRPGVGQVPLVIYNLSRTDRRRLVRAMRILSEVFVAAGAQSLILPTLERPLVRDPQALPAALQRRWQSRDFLLSAYHPVGSARVGLSARDSATSLDHECHRVPGLFVVDASSIPGSLGVNPQLTIMALATRAAERISHRLETRGAL